MSKKLYLTLFLIALANSANVDNWDYMFNDIGIFTTSAASTWRGRASVTNAWGYNPEAWDNTNQVWVSVSGGINSCGQDATWLYATNTQQTMGFRSNVASGVGWGTIYNTGVDIKVSSGGHVWYATATATTGGYTVVRFNMSTNTNTLMPNIGAMKVGPSPDGYAWIVTNSGTIKKYDGSSWVTMPGGATDVVVGSDGVPVILSNVTSTLGGYTVQRWNSTTSTWYTLDGIGGISISLDEYNTPYVVTPDFQVFRLKGKMSRLCPGKLLSILILLKSI